MCPTHPLSDVFSAHDLQRLAEGRCPVSGAKADPDIAGMLTESSKHPNLYLVSLAQWWCWWLQAHAHEMKATSDFRSRLRSKVGSREAFLQTAGELMAAYFLEKQQGLAVKPLESVSKGRSPDFRITGGELTMMVEVKTLVGGIPLRIRNYAGIAPDTAAAIRKAIKAATPQLDVSALNLLMIVDCRRPPIADDHVIDAASGDLAVRIPLAADGKARGWRWVREENARFQPKLNTRVGAIGVLLWNGSPNCSAYFVHNRHARNTIPFSVFHQWPQFEVNDAGEAREVQNPAD